MAGRIFRVGERKSFAGHRAHEPRPLAALCESPLLPTFKLTPKPEHKPRHKLKIIQKPPAIRVGVVAFFDGAFAQGRAAFGAVIYSNGQRIHKASQYLGNGPQLSCNVAEYAGAIEVLHYF